ncbi:hypothetical protein PENFLA_c074G10867 [Penicillium flavigenum]|uniref:Uncharacterized protein n=1 Tax=Penicillium flavigenum TaxID=254877 RepID=A0A1V6SB58_9EURO|nr:hypothetical protein PENFLA_c074G10867 [Penicillium flavigenum]
MADLQGKVVIVTGASNGMGLSVASTLLSQGTFVFGIDIATAPPSLLGNSSYEHYQSDLTQLSSPINAIKACQTAFGARIDVLINVAGIVDHYGSVDTLTDDIWDRVIAVDLTAPVRLMREVVNVMLKQEEKGGERGAILNVSSRAGMSGATAGVAYTSAKHGLIGATKQVAFRFRTEKIRCNAVAPGGVATNMTLDLKKMDRHAMPAIDAVRMAGQAHDAMNTPEEVASLIMYLVSGASKGVNGAIVPIDNGWSTI